MQGTKEKYNNFSLIDEKTLIQISAQVSLYQRDIPLATLPKTVSSITLYILKMPSTLASRRGSAPQDTHGQEGHHHVDGAGAHRHVLHVVGVHPRAHVDLVCVVVDLEGDPGGWWARPGHSWAPARGRPRPGRPRQGRPLPHSLPTAAGRP